MDVGEAIELARRWVKEEGCEKRGFCGAHLLGSLNGRDPESVIPRNIDVDVVPWCEMWRSRSLG